VDEIPQDSFCDEFARVKSDGISLDSEDWSELDTRSKLIDAILIKCLGWKEADIRRELSEDRSRLDYRLSTTRPMLVLEAKRFAISLSTKCPTSPNTIKTDSLAKSYPELQDHLRQVAQYCLDFSIPIGVLTNGKTYIAFCPLRIDGIPWREGRAIVVNNIFDSNFSFGHLYDLLSRDSVHRGGLSRALEDQIRAPIDCSVVSKYHDPNALQPGNELAQHLERVLTRVFTGMNEDSEEIIKNCYVKPGETSLRNDTIEFPLLDRPEEDDLHVVDVSNLNAFKQFEKTIEEHLSDSSTGSTLLVIGNLGVGKTIFLRRFFRPDCNPDHLPPNAVPFFLDYRASTLDPSRVLEDAYSRLRRQLEKIDAAAHDPNKNNAMRAADLSSPEAIRKLFQSDLHRFERTNRDLKASAEYPKMEGDEFRRLLADDRNYVCSCFQHLREHHKLNPCVILDNADHHTPEFQRHVYLAAKTFEQELGCLILLSLQESWYWHFRKEKSVLAHYQDRVFHIPAPRSKDVLAKRLDYAISIAKSLLTGISIDLGNGIVLEPTRLAEYLKLCRSAFFDDDEIAVCFEALSNGNIRKGMDHFASFIRSGHTNAKRYMLALYGGHSDKISLDEVIRSIACGKRRWYVGDRSPIPNIFAIGRINRERPFARFAPSYVLQYLAQRLRQERHNELGYVPRSEVVKFCEHLGLPFEEASELIGRLEDRELIRCGAKVDESSESNIVRISGLGNYVIKRLVGTASYISCVMLDTPIAQQGVFDLIAGEYKEHLTVLPERQERCITSFLTELESHEQHEWHRASQTPAGNTLNQVVPLIRQFRQTSDNLWSSAVGQESPSSVS
jgi:hypothetical protein